MHLGISNVNNLRVVVLARHKKALANNLNVFTGLHNYMFP